MNLEFEISNTNSKLTLINTFTCFVQNIKKYALKSPRKGLNDDSQSFTPYYHQAFNPFMERWKK